MPTLDMPLEQLKSYKGINPCPADIDTYWDNTLSRLKLVNPQIKLTPAEFTAPGIECFDLTFYGLGESRVYAKYLRPKGAKNCPAVIQFHGYTGNSGDWSDKLVYAQSGFAVAALDCRGQGGLSEDLGKVTGTTYNGQIIRGLSDGPESLLFRYIFCDTAQLTRIVMGFDEVDETRVGVMGGSQGGGLSLACASLVPEVNRCAPQYPFLSDYKRVWEMDLAKDAYKELDYYFRMYDPLHEKEDEIWHTLGYIDIKNIVKRIKGKTLIALTLLDNICPPSTQFAAYNHIIAEKEAKIYSDFGHEYLPKWPDIVYKFMCEML